MEGTTHFQGKGEEPTGKGKEREKMVRSLQDNRTRNSFKVSVGIAGKQVIHRMMAGQGHSSNRTKDNQILLERGTTPKARLSKVERKANPKMLVWNQRTSSAPQSETSTTVGTIDTVECTSLNLCAQEILNPRCITFSVDTGAGGTVLADGCGLRM